MTEDEMVGWHYQIDEHEFEKLLRVGDGQSWYAAVFGFAKNQTQVSD